MGVMSKKLQIRRVLSRKIIQNGGSQLVPSWVHVSQPDGRLHHMSPYSSVPFQVFNVGVKSEVKFRSALLPEMYRLECFGGSNLVALLLRIAVDYRVHQFSTCLDGSDRLAFFVPIDSAAKEN
ncbi:hypothetical protein FEM48_Zijuj04G0197800 [Ziziphus jujuba var. spinosa]|uniref:Uncharacterized protein n=1 Tax=Ziziphus jujuba var. spinosa TaxID=714518 RepID=A0A978VLU5_ZIZJJ|nr:hypothetical protein FEM48_Zijuj04G0197800 [Ziziphus jujuba var. spinosa]